MKMNQVNEDKNIGDAVVDRETGQGVMRAMKVERTVYLALSVPFSFFVTSAALHVWVHGTTKWPITYLAIAALCLHVRQIIYHEMLRKTLLEIIKTVSNPKD